MGNKFNRRKILFRIRPRYKSIGYARQSANKEISVGDQVEKLENAGCIAVFQDVVSSSNKERPQLDAALSILRAGDKIVFTKSDRVFSNQRHYIDTLCNLQGKGIHVRKTDGTINTTILGKFAPIVIGLLSGLVGVDRQIAIERT